MLLRSFQLSDYRPVSELLEDVLSEVCYEETRGALSKQLSWDSALVIVAEVNDEIVGVIIGTINNNQGYYYRIAVHSGYRRKGIGKSLIQSLKKRFFQRKVSRIFVTVDLHNEAILPLYESAGYTSHDFSRSSLPISVVNG